MGENRAPTDPTAEVEQYEPMCPYCGGHGSTFERLRKGIPGYGYRQSLCDKCDGTGISLTAAPPDLEARVIAVIDAHLERHEGDPVMGESDVYEVWDVDAFKQAVAAVIRGEQ